MDTVKLIFNGILIVIGFIFLTMAIHLDMRKENEKSQSALLWAIVCFVMAK